MTKYGLIDVSVHDKYVVKSTFCNIVSHDIFIIQ
jgi:hypothetical protein